MHHIADRMDVSHGTVEDSVKRVGTAIYKAFGRCIEMPLNGSREKAVVAAGFTDAGFGLARGIIDCTHMEVVVPTQARQDGAAVHYRDRHQKATLSFQVVVDASTRILSVHGGVLGSAYDTTVLEESPLYQFLERFLLPGEYLLGDKGYKLRGWMIRPYSPKEIAAGKDEYIMRRRSRFNKRYSGLRITVERTFGIMKARFRGLLRRLWFRDADCATYSLVFKACCVLNNLCLDAKDDLGEPEAVVEAMKCQAEWSAKLKESARVGEKVEFKKKKSTLLDGQQTREALFQSIMH